MKWAMAVVIAGVLANCPALTHAKEPASEHAKVTRLTDPQDDYPDLSPDNRRIIFQSNRSGRWQLWMMNRDGSGLTQIVRSTSNDRHPAWSRDGKYVAFSSDRGLPEGRRAIFIMEAPSTDAARDPRRVTEGSGQDIHPKWLPDGSGIVFNRIAADGKQADVYLTNHSGAERKLNLGPGLNTYASVDPTQRWLIFRGTSLEQGPTGSAVENSDIFIASADGSGRRRLTMHPAFDGWPAIAPDGRAIAFASRRGGSHFRIYLMPLEGGDPQPVGLPEGYNYTQPAWSGDGRSLVAYRWVQDSAGEVGQLVWIDLPVTLPAR
jgi:TolB protein